MKLLSRRLREQLASLQSDVLDRAAVRNTALRIFSASRGATTGAAQREYWLEFSWLDQEYRYAVLQLARFCARHGAVASDEDPITRRSAGS